MLKKVLIALGLGLALLVVVIAALGWWAFQTFTGPVYEPGTLAASAVALTPPPQTDGADGRWLVEPDIYIEHFERGRGRPVLFVHGGPGVPTREPMAWLATLYSEYTVHFYDQRGCGHSSRPFDRFTSTNFYGNMKQLEPELGLGAQIADIERIRRILGEEQLIIVGHSFGAFMATMYAVEFPERVEKLVLLSPADLLVLPPEHDLFALVRDRLPAGERVSYDAFLKEYLDFGAVFTRSEDELARMSHRLGNYILAAMGQDPIDEPPPGAHIDVGGWMTHAMYLSMGRHHDYTDALARVTAETLVVHGEGDLIPAAASRRYAELIDDAVFTTVPGADHFFAGEHADLGGTVKEFLTAREQ